MPPVPPPLLDLHEVSVRLGSTLVLDTLTWRWEHGQSWVLLGPNGAGKSTLIGVLKQQKPYFHGRIRRAPEWQQVERLALVSFDQQRRLVEREEKKDRWEEYSGREQEVLTARKLLDPEERQQQQLQRWARALHFETLLDHSVRSFSNGEMRKLLLLRALLTHPALLILDEPFDGLDTDAIQWLKQSLSTIIQSGVPVLLVTHRVTELVPEITHALCLKDGRIIHQGPRKDVLHPEFLQQLYAPATQVPESPPEPPPASAEATSTKDAPPLIQIRNLHLRYGEQVLFQQFSWTVRAHEHWQLVGPNGSGKSTLVKLICGDHPQGYASDLTLFGRRRGSGESIWDLKQKIGLVSPELQVGYRQSVAGRQVILSGFFDSIGLYRKPSDAQQAEVDFWIQQLGLEALAPADFSRLSYGQQRLLLLARAMVKRPPLLILDEPCQGLDPFHREHLLNLINTIGNQKATTLLYVTHLPEDALSCIHHTLRLPEATPEPCP